MTAEQTGELRAGRRSERRCLLRNEGGLLPLKKSLNQLAVIRATGGFEAGHHGIVESGRASGGRGDGGGGVDETRSLQVRPEVLFSKGVEIEREQASIFDDSFQARSLC